MIYQRGPDGNCIPGDEYTHKCYGKIPDTKHFQHWLNTSYEEVKEIFYWQWSTTFNRWGALVRFKDGQVWFTWPRLENQNDTN